MPEFERTEDLLRFFDKIRITVKYLNLLKEKRISTEAAESFVDNIKKDIKSLLYRFNDLSITEEGLNTLLRNQIIYNLQISFYLLREPWYRDIAGESVINKIDDAVLTGKVTWRELRISKETFYSTRRQIIKI